MTCDIVRPCPISTEYTVSYIHLRYRRLTCDIVRRLCCCSGCCLVKVADGDDFQLRDSAFLPIRTRLPYANLRYQALSRYMSKWTKADGSPRFVSELEAEFSDFRPWCRPGCAVKAIREYEQRKTFFIVSCFPVGLGRLWVKVEPL